MTMDSLISGPYSKPWKAFMDLSEVPRPSKHEEKIRQWLLDFANGMSWETRTDAVGNVVIRVPGKGRLKDLPPLILQGHMDMVCEKNEGTEHNFMTDPIRPTIVDGWITAGTTTLGADNGVAMAYGLGIAQEEMEDRLPLEILITTDEETGLTGAMELDASMLTGQHLLNLDSENEDEFIIGCAGGVDVTAIFSKESFACDGPLISCKVSGLRGGHSGISIHEGRANAIIVSGKILANIRNASPTLRLVSIRGGNKRNAIPRECTFTVSGCEADLVRKHAQDAITEIVSSEPNATVDVTELEENSSGHLPDGVIDFINGIPNGVLTMEPDHPGLVRTSSSLGVASSDETGVTFIICTRSSSESEKAHVAEEIISTAKKGRGTADAAGNYPGWEPFTGARLVAIAAETFEEVCGKAPVQRGIHAGLEAGIIGEALGTRELLAYGPQIENAHSPEERMNVKSFERGYRFLKALVARPVTAS